jgi:nascent polypeptide-associated complex subunit alpha
MIPGVDPRAMKQAMKKMGMKQEELDASAVIIFLDGKKIVFDNPSVQKIEMMGQVSFQLSGDFVEESIEDEGTEIDEDSIDTVVSQTGCSREDAISALNETKGDIAEAIILISAKREE